MRRISSGLILGGALMLLAGCSKEKEEDDWYAVRCEAQSNRLQLYRGVTASDVEDSDLGELTDVDSPINGQPCSVSTDNQGRAFTESEAVDAGLLPSAMQPMLAVKGGKGPAAAADPVINARYRTLPLWTPGPFAPIFSHLDLLRYPLPCPPGLQAYQVNHRQNNVTVYGFCGMRLIRQIGVASNPLQLALSPDGATVAVSSYDEAITFIDTATNSVKARMDVLNYNPQGIAYSPDGSRLYVTHYFDTNPSLLIIDPGARKVLSTVRLPQAYPRQVVVTPDGTQAWVNYFQGGVITVIDLTTETIAGSVQISQPVSAGMAFNPTGTKLFAAVFPNQVYAIDTSTLAIQTRIPVGQAPNDIVLSASGERVFVGCESDPAIYVIDSRANRLVARYAPKGANSTPGRMMGLLVFR